jgi:hypothetical protein
MTPFAVCATFVDGRSGTDFSGDTGSLWSA